MVGTAAGRITFWNRRSGARPIERADLTSSGSTVRTPLIVLSRIGQAQPYTMMEIFEVSPRPRISTKTGISAKAAVLRNTASSGLSITATGLYQPMSRPGGTARTMASPRPDSDRTMLAWTCWASSPSVARPHQAWRTWDSGGRNVASTRFSRGNTSQTAASTAIATLRWVIFPARVRGRHCRCLMRAGATGGGAGGAWTGGWPVGAVRGMTLVNEGLLAGGAGGVAFLGLRGAYLVVQQAPDLMSVPGKGGIRAQVLGRGTRLECDVDDLLDPAGSTGHHRDPLAEVHGLVDAVGDEHDRLAGPLPDAQQLVLQAVAGLRVQLGEPGQPHQDQELPRLVPAGAPRDPLALQPELHVGLCGAPGEQGVPLEHHAPVQARSGHRPPVEQDLSRGRLAQPGQQVQQRGLAAAARADQDQKLSTVDVDADVGQRGHLNAATGEHLADPAQTDLRGHRAPPERYGLNSLVNRSPGFSDCLSSLSERSQSIQVWNSRSVITPPVPATP